MNSLLREFGIVADPPSPSVSASSSSASSLPAFAQRVAADESSGFRPQEPASLDEAGLSPALLEGLVLKLLLAKGSATGREISEQLKLPFSIVFDFLRSLKSEELIVYRRSAGLHDFDHELTGDGHDRARRLYDQCSYHGAAPVAWNQYLVGIETQSPLRDCPTADDLAAALSDLQINPDIFKQVGQAISSVSAIFLYGAPGNGKTSIAERLTAAFGPAIWIPRAVLVDGDVMRLFDPLVHQELPTDRDPGGRQGIDQRWVRIRRPTVVVGGELTLESLEMRHDRSTGTIEAPVHLKSNCGTLVVDDFGRQRCAAGDLLNRWIVPLEKRYDYLNTPSGKKIQVPFDQLIVFATNLEPKHLVDEAFLRRIPYKIRAYDPSEAEFRTLFANQAAKHGLEHSAAALDHLVEKHYRGASRPFRYCHARDLLLQVRNHCRFLGRDPVVTIEALDDAVKNYFAEM